MHCVYHVADSSLLKQFGMTLLVLSLSSILVRQNKFNSVYDVGGVAVERRQIARRQVLQFGAPTRVGNFDPQPSIGETYCLSTARDSRSAGQRPCQHGTIGSTPHPARHNLLESLSDWFHGAFDFSIPYGVRMVLSRAYGSRYPCST